ncbi:MAG: oligosaccharide flippase family protein [Candidatus Hydrogenedentales bacterium]
MNLRRTIARNTVYNGLGRAWEALTGLIVVAYVIHELGAGAYGLWAVAAAFTGYAALLDLGLSSGFAKFIAEHDARRESSEIAAVVATGTCVYAFLGTTFLLVTWPAAAWLIQDVLPRFAGAGSDWADPLVREELLFLVRGGLCLFVAGQVLAPFTAVATGLQRMDITNAWGAAAGAVKLMLLFYFMSGGHGIRSLLYAQAGSSVVFAAGMICAVFVICPALRTIRWRVSRRTFRRLFGFGWRSQVARLANLVMFETDVLVIALLLHDFRIAGVYRVAVDLANKLRQAGAILLSALVPAAAHLDAQRDTVALRALYLRATRYLAAFVVPAALFLAVSAEWLIAAWVGPNIDAAFAAGILRILLAGYVANLMCGPGVAIALGRGDAGLVMRAGLLSMFANIGLTIALLYAVGFWGIPVATAISMAVCWIWFANAVAPTAGGGFAVQFAPAFKIPLQAAVPGAVIVAGMQLAGLAPANRLGQLAVVVAAGALFSLTYLLLLRRWRFFTPADGAVWRDLLPGRTAVPRAHTESADA